MVQALRREQSVAEFRNETNAVTPVTVVTRKYIPIEIPIRTYITTPPLMDIYSRIQCNIYIYVIDIYNNRRYNRLLRCLLRTKKRNAATGGQAVCDRLEREMAGLVAAAQGAAS